MKRKKVWLLGALSSLLLVVDATTKYWVAHNLPHISSSSGVYPFGGIGIFQGFLGIDFAINKATNTGGAWGLFSTYPQTLLFIRVSIILAFSVYALSFNRSKKRAIPFTLILTGAAANVIDTFLYGSVIDMFHCVLWGYSFPIFNVADTLICCGAIALIVQEFFRKSGRRSRAAESSKS